MYFTSIQTAFPPLTPSLTAHPRSNYLAGFTVILEIPAMTIRQSYYLTFARFSPSLSVKSFTASEAANTAYRVEITATSTDSSLPLSSYLNQRAAFEIRPQEAVLSEVAAAFSAGSDESPAKQWQGIVTSCEKLSVSKDETVLPKAAASRCRPIRVQSLYRHRMTSCS
ncbi:hypothetical protein [Neisseria elongata]